MTEREEQENPLYQIEGPFYQDGVWTANMTLKAQRSETFRSATKEAVQEQLLHFLGQQALEIEKTGILLRKTVESQSEEEAEVPGRRRREAS